MKNYYLSRLVLLTLFSSLFVFQSKAQTDSTSSTAVITDFDDLFDMSLDDLMNINVVSASKKSESSFDAPITISSVSKEEIRKAGVTSIPEALRLIPGLLVTETTNGNYEVQIRGLNSLPPSSTLYNSSNSITLVMINNRPVYNYFNGGTFWETLPIDLNDVEQIEVVRGASSALYGPNAAAGVINIITRKVTKEGIGVLANAQAGTLNTVITNASLTYKKENFSAIVSGNFQGRDRSQDDYYNWVSNRYVDRDTLRGYVPFNQIPIDANKNPNAHDVYPNPSLALNKVGYNAFLEYKIKEEDYVSLNVGGQNSTAQTAFAENFISPITTRNSTTNYVDAKVKLGNFSAMLADNLGTQNIARGISGYKVDLNTLDANAEYDIQIKGLSIKPGVNFRNASYDDSKYANIALEQGFVNGKKQIANYAGSLRAEYTLFEKLKLVAAGRVDKYDVLKKSYTSYQFTANYKLNENNLVRGGISRSYRSPTFYDMYNTQMIPAGPVAVAKGVNFDLIAQLQGNKDINMLKIQLYEVGYRSKILHNLHLDVDVFYQVATDYSLPINVGGAINPKAKEVTNIQKILNIDLITKQLGTTIALNYATEKIQFKPFVTIQQTKLEQATKYRRDTIGVSKAPSEETTYRHTYDTTSHFTPSVFGGFYVNYAVSKKFNVGLNTYFFTEYTYDNIVNAILLPSANPVQQKIHENGVGKVSGKTLVNIKIGYKPIEKLELFVNLRNVLNQNSYEFIKTDKTPFMALVGATFSY